MCSILAVWCNKTAPCFTPLSLLSAGHPREGAVWPLFDHLSFFEASYFSLRAGQDIDRSSQNAMASSNGIVVRLTNLALIGIVAEAPEEPDAQALLDKTPNSMTKKNNFISCVLSYIITNGDRKQFPAYVGNVSVMLLC